MLSHSIQETYTLRKVKNQVLVKLSMKLRTNFVWGSTSHFYSPWKHPKISIFLMFSGDVEIEDCLKWVNHFGALLPRNFHENICFLRCAFFISSGNFLDTSILKRSITRNSFNHSTYCCYYYCCFSKVLSLIFWQNKYNHVEGYVPLFQKPRVFF